MPRKSTVTAPSNIAFIKYWGARNLKRAIPSNPSISMTLESSISRSTVELVDGAGEHEIRWR
ncbi:MAG: diphosphomevalonate decarboxylase, partial [bacterium]|nr:diphosphomevalonate decarboxylase [bacterium]